MARKGTFKHTISGVAAASLVLGAMAPMTFAASHTKHAAATVNYNLRTIDIGKYNKPVYGIAARDWTAPHKNYTEFLPAWYILQGLGSLGYTATWNGNTEVLNITTPSAVSLTNVTPNAKPMTGLYAQIEVNGTVVQYGPRIVAKDPKTGVYTSYIPIYYINQALSNLGLKISYDGNVWMVQQPTTQQLSSITIGGATAGNGSQSAPATVQNGGSVTLTTTLTDSNGNPIPNTQVTYWVTGGTDLSATQNGVSLPEGTSNGSDTFIATTDGNGVASIVLTDNSGLTQPLTVQASAPYTVNGTALETSKVYVEYLSNGSVSLTPTGSPYITSLGTTVPVTVTLPVANGAPQANVTVNFTLNQGTNAYFTNSSGAYLGTTVTAVTNAEGQATVWVNDEVNGGEATVTVSGSTPYTTITGTQTLEWLQAGVPTSVNNLTVSNATLQQNGTYNANAGQNVTISGSVVDATGNPVANAQLLVGGPNGNAGSDKYVSGTTATSFPGSNIAQGLPASSSYGDLVSANANGFFTVVVNDSNGGDVDAYKVYGVQNGAVSSSTPLNGNAGTTINWVGSSGFSAINAFTANPGATANLYASGTGNSKSEIVAPGTATSDVYFAPVTTPAGALMPTGVGQSMTYTLKSTNGNITAIDGAALLNAVGSLNVTVTESAYANGVGTYTLTTNQGGFTAGSSVTVPAADAAIDPYMLDVTVSDPGAGSTTVTAASGSQTGTVTITVPSAANQAVSVTSSQSYINYGQATVLSIKVEDASGNPVANAAIPVQSIGSNAPLWITAINGTNLTATTSTYGTQPAPIPLFQMSGLGYSSVGFANVGSASNIGSASPSMVAYTNASGVLTLQIQNGLAQYWNGNSVQTDSTAAAQGTQTLDVGINTVNGTPTLQIGNSTAAFSGTNGVAGANATGFSY